MELVWDSILHDYRNDIYDELNEGNQDILYKTLKYELSKYKGVEDDPIVLEAYKEYFPDIWDRYTTTDLMNGWWYCFRSIFMVEHDRPAEETKDFCRRLMKAIENNCDIREYLRDGYKDAETLLLFKKYLKVVYTIGNMTPAPKNPGGGGYGLIDFWDYKLFRFRELYHDHQGDIAELRFDDYVGAMNNISGKKFNDYMNSFVLEEYMHERIELIIRRGYRVVTYGKCISDDDLKQIIEKL